MLSGIPALHHFCLKNGLLLHGRFPRIPAPSGNWTRGTWLLATSTAQPTLLALPFAMASLGWAGGLAVLLVSGAVTVLCNILLAGLFEYGGRRNTRYRDLAKRVMGGWVGGGRAGGWVRKQASRHAGGWVPLPELCRVAPALQMPVLSPADSSCSDSVWRHVSAGARHPYAYQLILIPQFTVIIGVGVANLILAAQCLQAVDSLYSGGECVLCLRSQSCGGSPCTPLVHAGGG